MTLGSERSNQHPLPVAIRATRVIGVASALLGLVFIIGYGYFNRYTLFRPIFILAGLAIWFIPGVLYYTCAAYLDKRRRFAATSAGLIAFVQLLFAVTALYLQIFHLTPISPIPILLTILWCAALVDLMVRLRRTLPYLTADTTARHGFDLSAPKPVVPIVDDQRIESVREK